MNRRKGGARSRKRSTAAQGFARNLRRICRARRISVAELAKRSGRKPDVIEKLVAGQGNPRIKLIGSVADSIGVSLEELMQGL